jgi:hypothetical protein
MQVAGTVLVFFVGILFIPSLNASMFSGHTGGVSALDRLMHSGPALTPRRA